MYWSILEVFNYGEYSALNVNGKLVVDIGAFVDDSSIYNLKASPFRAGMVGF